MGGSDVDESWALLVSLTIGGSDVDGSWALLVLLTGGSLELGTELELKDVYKIG